MRERIIRVLVLLVTICVSAASLLSAPALASPWARGCGTARDGFVAGKPDANYNYPWFVVGPWQIGMSAKTARSIAQRAPVEEFGYHEKAVEIPCNVAQNIAESGAKAWVKWSGNDGWIGVTRAGYSVGPYLGRLYCTGVSQKDGGARETCHHNADRHAGAITGKFLIVTNPKYTS
jgi:hypothetical protein